MNLFPLKIFLCVLMACCISDVSAQDDLLAELEDEAAKEETFATAIFKGTRIINSHSVKTRAKKELEFIISHRFGRINSGGYELFGLDNSFIRLGLEYGITDRLNVGIGRSSFDKTYDTFIKYNVIKQTVNSNKIPVAVTLFADNVIRTSPKSSNITGGVEFSSRLAQTVAVMIARKFNSNFSAQITPTYIHRNQVTVLENNSTFALSTGFRLMVSKSVSINFEHFFRANPPDIDDRHNPVALGVDIETGGHVFQLHLTNTRGMINRAIIEETTGDVRNGDIHFGFNITRTFQL